MIRRTASAALVTLAAATLLGCSLGSISSERAREAIEGIPYRVFVHEPEGEDEVLVGIARGRHGAAVHFAAVTDLEDDAVPAYLRAATDGNATGGGGWWVFSDSEEPHRGESRARWLERVRISVAIEEALCFEATGDPCPV